jgi:hypothetical protein
VFVNVIYGVIRSTPSITLDHNFHHHLLIFVFIAVCFNLSLFVYVHVLLLCLNSVLFPLIIELRELISLPSVTVVQDRLDNNERFNTMNRSRISTIITLKIDIIIIKREGGFYDYQHVFSTMPKRQKTTQKSSNAAKKSKPLTTKDGHEGEACKDVDTSPVLKGPLYLSVFILPSYRPVVLICNSSEVISSLVIQDTSINVFMSRYVSSCWT